MYRLSLPGRMIRCIICDFTQEWGAWKKRLDTCQFGGGELERYECPKCECVFGAQKYLDLEEAFVDLDYRVLYSRYAEGDSTSNEIKTFRSLNPTSEGLYLDWGCGGLWSKTVSTLRSEGYDIWGFEPSAQTSGDFIVNDQSLISTQFNGIFSNNVIEHFREPIEQFRYFHSILKPDGVMAHSSPCYEWSYAFTRFHTLFLLGKSPHVLAERTGFKVQDQVQDGEYINYVFVRT
ncbi:methyltransferase [Blastopirellula marina]|uniref:Methyltransferase n=1 Tax=Blastopirellula marina TaxID=124 RepID=A0A2S8G4R7_9BACT|nr:methyltransferase [Blastopirellula marina]RCS55758.1 class I SAM-dependent methyltransferase [Bremerella cremea]